MKRHRLIVAALLCALAQSALASCGTSTQTVTISAPGRAPLSWSPRDDTPKRVEVAGVALGVQVVPTGRAAATRHAVRGQADGLWAIRLYDMAAAPPALLSTAHGAPNSTHAFDASHVAALGNAVLTVRLVNGGCA